MVAEAVSARLLTLGAEPPARVPLWVNAADAVLVPSERESFGLAVLEALACEVPVLATPQGVAPEALAGLDGTLCAPFAVEAWAAAVRRVAGQRVAGGPERAARWSAAAMAERVVAAWREAVGRGPSASS